MENLKGLTPEEVEEKIKQGKTNKIKIKVIYANKQLRRINFKAI